LARKILLADDSVTAQNMGRKILADAGYEVVTVNNGSAALKRIAEMKPDLIVLDVYMPGYSGLEVCQRLKDAAETAHIPVLLTVGKLEPFKAEEARRVRADAHIVKPFEASELLTAITRLEDRVVPHPSEGAHFSDGSGRKTGSDAEADTGWKSRLRFPSKKKKEEPEPEDVAAAATFRDFRKGKGKNGASAAVTTPEPGQVLDIPRDITPEELDVLSVLAAKLDGPIPAPESIALPVESIGPVEAPAAELAVARTELEVPAAAEAKQEDETPALVVEPTAAAVEATACAIEAPALTVEGKNEVEIPVEHMELAAEGATEVADPAAVESHRYEPQHPETPAAVVAVAVNTALFAQEPAPVDRNDEPMFASAASAVEQAAEEKIEGRPAEAVAKSETTEAEEPAPGEAELAEALRLLTPATGYADVSTVPSHGTLVTAGQLLAEEAARNAAAGPRWVAEPVTLSPEEAAISLEAEMFRTFAAMPEALSAATSGGEIEPTRSIGVSAIAAAVENRLAAAEMAAVSKAASPLVDGISPEIWPEEKIAPGIEPEKRDPEQKDSAAKVAEESPAEEVAAATCANAAGQDEVEATAKQNGETVSGTTAAVAEENQDSSSDSGSQESMGRNVKAKSGKSTWQQVRTAPASVAASSDAVEAAKQAEHGAEEAPKVMAAAAAAEGGTASVSATDASTIASIVDSVMANLRPKIVEEITRKLAGK
jgi:CheY-like chemotaxis protein